MKNAALTYRSQTIAENINVCLRSGITLILGDVGCGKSSLLKAIFGDVTSKGTIHTFGKVSYACEEPWLFPGTIRQNIIFNEPLDETRYKKVIEICALQKDVSMFSSGDQTLLTDKGQNLSQGQRIRINLARAVYKEADIYLLDDCLSAVDVNVGRHIFFKCIKDFLNNKVCVLVCHLHTFVKNADQIIVISSKGVQFSGSYSQLMSLGAEMPNKFYDLQHEKETDKIETKESDMGEQIDKYSSLGRGRSIKTYRNVYQENAENGSVKINVYYKYISSGGIIMFLVIIIIAILRQVADTSSDYFIRYWVESEQNRSTFKIRYEPNFTGYVLEEQSQKDQIYNYSLVTLAATAFLFLTYFTFYTFAAIASIRIHRQLLNRVLNAGMDFYDKHLTGNIINRFSRDLSIIDENLPFTVAECIRVTLSIAAILFIASSVNLWFAIPSLCFAVILYMGRRAYVSAGRKIRRVEGATRSPIIGYVQATFDGLATIKAREAQTDVLREFENYVDVYTSTLYMHIATAKCFSFYLDMLTVLYTGIIVYTLPFIENDIGAGQVGLVLTQTLVLTGFIQFAVQQWAELELQMTSVERVLEYLKFKPENKSGNMLEDCLSKGKIIYKDVRLRYSEVDVLKNINFTIEAGTKIGIVGRTGAGKSSIVSVLFRLYKIEGAITLDSIDISTIALETLRSRISIVPQYPVLFTGTIRSNLDPKSLYTDKQLWSALEKVEMKNKICSLDLAIGNDSTNFSIGQKQLICLARTILQNNVVVVFDEATANVDEKTCCLIQRVIEETFTENTMIIIAHRLRTVMNCDKILVLDAGTVIEYDHPTSLLKNENSAFYNMVKSCGLPT